MDNEIFKCRDCGIKYDHDKMASDQDVSLCKWCSGEMEEERENETKFLNKKYQILYADPPWRYSFSKSRNRKVENHYPTMLLKDIANLEVPADNNAVLYLWATAPKLLEALFVMESWGFQYKTHAIWDKKRIGMGYWFRGQHELLLVGTKGKFSPPKPEFRVSSVHVEKRTVHSCKPDSIREQIAKSFSKSFNKIELFARQKIKGWDVWGNEV